MIILKDLRITVPHMQKDVYVTNLVYFRVASVNTEVNIVNK